MCLPNINNNNENSNDAQNNKSAIGKTKARTPWGRFKQQLKKPRLSRKIVPSSKINLNNFWTEFESADVHKTAMVEFTQQSSEVQDNIINELLDF